MINFSRSRSVASSETFARSSCTAWALRSVKDEIICTSISFVRTRGGVTSSPAGRPTGWMAVRGEDRTARGDVLRWGGVAGTSGEADGEGAPRRSTASSARIATRSNAPGVAWRGEHLGHADDTIAAISREHCHAFTPATYNFEVHHDPEYSYRPRPKVCTPSNHLIGRPCAAVLVGAATPPRNDRAGADLT